MFGGNNNQMKQMMKQMGIDMEEISASKVIIETESGENIVFENPDVNKMDAQGQTIHQVIGDPDYVDDDTQDRQDKKEKNANQEDEDNNTQQEVNKESKMNITDEDVNIVSLRADVTEDKAREKLEENDGDLAKSISDLS